MRVLTVSVTCLLLTTLFSGCAASRVCENVLAIGVVDYYACGNGIKDGLIYRLNDEYYSYAVEKGYAPSPGWFGIAVPFTGYWPNSVKSVEVPERLLLVKMNPEFVNYCLGDNFLLKIGETYRLYPWGTICDTPVDLSEAESITITTYPSIPSSLLSPEYHSVDGIHLRRERHWASWLLAPVALAALAWDVPVTIAASATLWPLGAIMMPIGFALKTFESN